MSCLGVLFSINEQAVNKLKGTDRNDLVEFIQEEIEKEYFDNIREQVAELDKSWDAIQRAFSKHENDMSSKEGEYPLNHLIYGSEVLYGDKDNEDDYIVTLKTPKQVVDIYNALSLLTEEDFKEKYYAIDEVAYDFTLSEEDFLYTWGWLSDTLSFWKLASEHGLYVIFTVGQ